MLDDLTRRDDALNESIMNYSAESHPATKPTPRKLKDVFPSLKLLQHNDPSPKIKIRLDSFENRSSDVLPLIEQLNSGRQFSPEQEIIFSPQESNRVISVRNQKVKGFE